MAINEEFDNRLINIFDVGRYDYIRSCGDTYSVVYTFYGQGVPFKGERVVIGEMVLTKETFSLITNHYYNNVQDVAGMMQIANIASHVVKTLVAKGDCFTLEFDNA